MQGRLISTVMELLWMGPWASEVYGRDEGTGERQGDGGLVW